MAYQGVHTFDPSDHDSKAGLYTEYSPYEAYELQPQHSRRESSNLPQQQYQRPTKWFQTRSFAWRLGYILCGIVLIVLWTLVMILFANQEKRYAQRNEGSDTERLRAQTANPGEEATFPPSNKLFVGSLRQFDLSSRKLTIQWSGATLSSVNNDTLVPFGTKADERDEVITEIGIYQDLTLLPDPELDEIYPENAPWLAISNRTAKRVGTLGLHEWDSFNTEVDLLQERAGDVWTQPLFGYPWDRWAGEIVLVANFPVTCTNVNTTAGCSGFTFDGISVRESIQNWKIRATAVDTCTSQNSIGTVGCEMHVKIKATRPAIVIFCVVVVVSVNWLSTLAIFILVCEAVIMKRYHVLDETDILGVCFSALFALPSVRSLLPAAPDFAAIIDLIGILPNVIIISLCTTAVAGSRIARRLRLDEGASGKTQ